MKSDAPPTQLTVSSPQFDREIEDSVLAVLRSGHIAQGPKVAEFEAQCAAMAGTEFAVAVANGTVALEASLEVLGIGSGDQVITSPFTFAATVNAVIRTGATVRFADIDDDFTISVASVESLINERTRAVVPVHLYGLMADMNSLAPLAEDSGLAIVEDAAQAHGATQGTRKAGGTGLGCFSFYATKNVTSAEGGVITTADELTAARLRTLRNQGMAGRYEYIEVGRNLRLTDLAAAVAVPQMRRLTEINAARQRNAAILTTYIAATGADVVVPRIPSGREHVWHQFTVLLPDGVERAAVVQRMQSRGVTPGVYYPRLAWDYACYRAHPGIVADATPVAAHAAARCLSLPVHHRLTEQDMYRVARALASSI